MKEQYGDKVWVSLEEDMEAVPKTVEATECLLGRRWATDPYVFDLPPYPMCQNDEQISQELPPLTLAAIKVAGHRSCHSETRQFMRYRGRHLTSSSESRYSAVASDTCDVPHELTDVCSTLSFVSTCVLNGVTNQLIASCIP
jgi:hypothetical protein